MEKLQQFRRKQEGKLGYILLWALGVPIPILFVIFLLRGCTRAGTQAPLPFFPYQRRPLI